MPAVALWVVTSRPATRSISSVKEESATEKEAWVTEKPGLEWRQADEGVG